MECHERPTKFAEQASADHVIALGGESQGIEGSTNGLMMLGVGTSWRDIFPAKFRTTDEAILRLHEFAGPKQHVKSIHIDNAKELTTAAAGLGWRTDKSTPYVSESNGIIEREIGLTSEGTRAIIETSGLGSNTWPYAAKHFCHARNFEVQRGNSAYHRIHGEGHFTGQEIPYGAEIDFLPPKPKLKKLGKFEPRAVPGVMMGYHLATGGDGRESTSSPL